MRRGVRGGLLVAGILAAWANAVYAQGSIFGKGTLNGTFENDRMQSDNVTEELYPTSALPETIHAAQ